MSKELSFEQGLKKLESIAEKLESGDLPLEQAIDLYEEGIKISRLCQAQLEKIEKRVEKLSKDTEGKFFTEPLTLNLKEEEDAVKTENSEI
ncbi:MAG: exodeoxyribonuclease VII small subunit [Candidatus Edwardsbacteria bacterium]